MNPWITGRIIEHMQHDSRARGDEARLARIAAAHRAQLRQTGSREPRRARVGLAVARLGLRIAGRTPQPVPNVRSTPWTTCSATSTSSR